MSDNDEGTIRTSDAFYEAEERDFLEGIFKETKKIDSKPEVKEKSQKEAKTVKSEQASV